MSAYSIKKTVQCSSGCSDKTLGAAIETCFKCLAYLFVSMNINCVEKIVCMTIIGCYEDGL